MERVTPQGASLRVQHVPNTFQPVWRETDPAYELTWTVHANPLHMFDHSRTFCVQMASQKSNSFVVFGDEVYVETTRGNAGGSADNSVAEAEIRAWLAALSDARVAALTKAATPPAPFNSSEGNGVSDLLADDNDGVFSSSDDDADHNSVFVDESTRTSGPRHPPWDFRNGDSHADDAANAPHEADFLDLGYSNVRADAFDGDGSTHELRDFTFHYRTDDDGGVGTDESMGDDDGEDLQLSSENTDTDIDD